jgi:putative toxin-antitoxin system antitoxin component (TIGR02293 family)
MAGSKYVRSPETDFVVVVWTIDTPESEVRSAFRSKWEWVVPSSASVAAWYSILISNLLRTYATPEDATVEHVRDTISLGLHRDAFNRLKAVIDTSGESLARVLRIPARTLARREVFKPDESERILRVASAFQRAIDVLGSLEKARRWFSSRQRALGGRTPLEFCDTEPGADEVVRLLGRIEHGVFT